VEKLKYFILYGVIDNDCQLYYLKWLFSNLNYLIQLKLYLKINKIYKTNIITNESPVDANFIRKYFMGDTLTNLIHFDFYIISECELFSNNSERIINSFKNEPFFVEHQWTNVKYLFDPIKSYQHLSSSIINMSRLFHDLIDYPELFEWPNITCIQVDFCPDAYEFLKEFNKLCPKVSCIKFNITCYDYSMNENKTRAIILAHLISMPVQLTYLRVQQFQWLLHLVEYASNQLRKNTLNSVKYLGICLTSCHFGSNESIQLGKSLVPFLSNYMPHLEILCLWRPDDFPWTSIRPDFKPAYYGILAQQWRRSLRTFESIVQHVNIFEQDLCQLVDQLKQLLFLDIYGSIENEKTEAYRIMIQKRFCNSQFLLERSRFRLWI
ncbi:unnamed protein product, partial [Rotaria sp. Silwood2]